MDLNPGRYAIYRHPVSGWHVTSNMEHIDLRDSLAEAVDAACAHAEAESHKVPTC